jgi:hypothetical protein
VNHRTIQLALAVTLMGAAIAYAADLGPLAGSGSDRSPAHAQRAAKVEIRGHVTGLYPGARKRMQLRVHNAYSRHVSLRDVRTRVLDASPGCAARHLSVRRNENPRRIPARRAIQVRVLVRLRMSAPDACQAARWPLRFSGRVKGSR